MKTCFVVILLVAGLRAAPAQKVESQKTLLDHAGDFLDVMPLNKIYGIVLEYLSRDEGVARGIEYLRSAEFQGVFKKVDASPEFRQFLDALEAAGFAAYKHVNAICPVIGLPRLASPGNASASSSSQPTEAIAGGVFGLRDDLLNELPRSRLAQLYADKTTQGADELVRLVEVFSGGAFQVLKKYLLELPEIKAAIDNVLSGKW